MIGIKGDIKGAVKYLQGYQRKVIPQAVPAALNKTSALINTATRKAMAQELGFAQKHFKKRLKVFRAKRNKWESSNWVGTKIQIPVSAVFKSGAAQMRYSKASVNVPLGELFTATMPTGHKGVFYKKPGAKGKVGRDSKGRVKKGRLPIQEVMIDLSEAANKVLPPTGRRIVSSDFSRLLAHELKYRLGRLNAR